MEEGKKIRFGVIACLLTLIVGLLPVATYAAGATIYLYPNTGTYQVGKTFSVNVALNTPDQAVNAVSGLISFPTDKLEVVGLGKGGSIISLWVQEPSFSNSAGSINFEGIVFNPGFTGNGAQILGITFRAKTVGSARVVISNASALANDGSGTNVLAGVGAATYSIIVAPEAPAEEPAPPAEEAPAGELPSGPTIVSSTHPSSEGWYSVNDIVASWELPEGTTGVSYEFNQTADTEPNTTSEGTMSQVSFTDVRDGIWYLHVRLRTAAGWGATTHRRFGIDTVAPEPFTVLVDADGDETDGRPGVTGEATDATSGIARYEYYIENIFIRSAKGNEMSETLPFRLPFRTPGTYILKVRAIDAAGNATDSAETVFTITTFAPPVITDYPDQLNYGDALTIGGESYPNAEITIRVIDSAGREILLRTETDDEGKFEFTTDRRFRLGMLDISAKVSMDGYESVYSASVQVSVQRSLAAELEDLTNAYLLTLLIGGILIAILLAALIYAWLRSRQARLLLLGKRGNKDIFYHPYTRLHDDVLARITSLHQMAKKGKLSKQEEHLLDGMTKDLKDVEKLVNEELHSMARHQRAPKNHKH